LHSFFFEIAKDIDFDKGYEFLDKKLAKIVQGSEVGKRLADVLIKVYLQDETVFPESKKLMRKMALIPLRKKTNFKNRAPQNVAQAVLLWPERFLF